MATRGYDSYRGRASAGKKALIAVLIVILLGAVAFLFCQNYLVYDDEGNIHLELPWSKEETAPTEENTISPDDVELTREEPVGPAIAQLQAKELAFDRIESDVSDLMQEAALVIDVSRYDGDIAYATSVALPEQVSRGSAAALANLKTLLAGNGYAVARISCLADTSYARAAMEEVALMRDDQGDTWYDNSGECWLDPTKEGTLTYLTALCQECADLGFDEILLDNLSYPTTGNIARIYNYANTDKAKVLADFAQKLREALPEDIAVSIEVNEPLAANGGDSGITAELLQQFDRVYVNTESVDAAAVTAALPADFVIPGRVVSMVSKVPTQGSYLLLS